MSEGRKVTVPSYTIYEGHDHIEVLFDVAVPIEDDDYMEQLNESVAAELMVNVDDLDWRDDQTLWLPGENYEDYEDYVDEED